MGQYQCQSHCAWYQLCSDTLALRSWIVPLCYCVLGYLHCAHTSIRTATSSSCRCCCCWRFHCLHDAYHFTATATTTTTTTTTTYCCYLLKWYERHRWYWQSSSCPSEPRTLYTGFHLGHCCSCCPGSPKLEPPTSRTLGPEP